VNAEFNWWLLIVGLGVGAGLTWLIVSDIAHRDEELSERETVDEIAWVAETLAANGRPTSPETIRRVLDLHRVYVQRERPIIEDDRSAPAEDGSTGEEGATGH
jgi:hypothetical protein